MLVWSPEDLSPGLQALPEHGITWQPPAMSQAP